MARHILSALLVSACIATSAPCDTIAYCVQGSNLYEWNLDHPELEPTEGKDVGVVAMDMLPTPDRRQLIIPTNFKNESRAPVGTGLVVADLCPSGKVSVCTIAGVDDFDDDKAAISRDGKTLYAIGTPGDGGCRLEDVQFACLVIDIEKASLVSSFCTTKVWLGPNDRVYYRPLFNPDVPFAGSKLLSRNGRGEDERVELSNIPQHESGGLRDVFGLDGMAWLIFCEYHGKADEAFCVYRLKNDDTLELMFRHAGKFLGYADGRIRYWVSGSKDVGNVDCREPSRDVVLTTYFKDTPPPYDYFENAPIRNPLISQDGKKHFYIGDEGITEPLTLCVYDLEKKSWLPRYVSKTLNGGIMGPVLIDDPCGNRAKRHGAH